MGESKMLLHREDESEINILNRNDERLLVHTFQSIKRIIRACIASFRPDWVCTHVPEISSGISISIGVIMLTDWMIHLFSKNLVFLTPNALTSVLFILAGISLRWTQSKETVAGYRHIAQACVGAIVFTAFLMVAKFFGHSAFPRQIPFTTALGFLLIGSALLFKNFGQGRRFAQISSAIAGLTAWLAVLGYLYNVPSFYTLGFDQPMTLVTALGFLALSVGLLSLCSRLVILITATLGILVGLGWLRLIGEQAGLYDSDFGVSLMIASHGIILSMLVLWNARLLHGVDLQRRRAEEALRNSEERYRQLVEMSPDAIFIHRDGRFLFANQATLTLHGVQKSKELIGKDVLDFIHPEGHKHLAEKIRHAKEEALSEAKLLRLDGRVIDVEMTSNPIIFQGQAADQIIMRDISHRKHAQAARAHLVAMATGDAIIGLNTGGFVTSWNKDAESIFNYGPSEARGKPVSFLMSENNTLESDRVMEKLRQGKIECHEAECIRKDGHRLRVFFTGFPIMNASGKITGISVIARDITKQKYFQRVPSTIDSGLKSAKPLAGREILNILENFFPSSTESIFQREDTSSRK